MLLSFKSRATHNNGLCGLLVILRNAATVLAQDFENRRALARFPTAGLFYDSSVGCGPDDRKTNIQEDATGQKHLDVALYPVAPPYWQSVEWLNCVVAP